MNYAQWLMFALGGILGIMLGVWLSSAWVRWEREDARRRRSDDALAAEVDAMMGTERGEAA
jgi:hypothetical protein